MFCKHGVIEIPNLVYKHVYAGVNVLTVRPRLVVLIILLANNSTWKLKKGNQTETNYMCMNWRSKPNWFVAAKTF